MTGVVIVLASVVAVVAAVRSTWSPCGLSMLSTITPFSEQARGSSFGATATWFLVGAVSGGATLGLTMAALALGVGLLHLTASESGLMALGAAVVVAASDGGLARAKLPYHRRQVNERWLDQYRPWVYGAGFGWQIGSGLATYITTAAVYLLVALGALTGRPSAALALGTAFGFLRGLAVFLTARLRGPADLRAFHRRFMAAAPMVNRTVIVVEMASVAVLAAVLHTGAGPALIAGTVAVAVAWRWLGQRAGRDGEPPGCPVPPGTVGARAVPAGPPAMSPERAAVRSVR